MQADVRERYTFVNSYSPGGDILCRRLLETCSYTRPSDLNFCPLVSRSWQNTVIKVWSLTKVYTNLFFFHCLLYFIRDGYELGLFFFLPCRVGYRAMFHSDLQRLISCRTLYVVSEIQVFRYYVHKHLVACQYTLILELQKINQM